MMQAFLAGIQQQNATVNVAMQQINKTMMELARGQTQLLMMRNDPWTLGSAGSAGLPQEIREQAQALSQVAMEVEIPEAESSEWDEVNPNAEDFGSP